MREFKIPGKVQAKQRPRMNLHNGRVYTPQSTINYENYVKMCYLNHANTFNWNPLQGALKAEIEVFVTPPKSDSKKKKVLKLSNAIRPALKPDCDNLAKSILDSLNKIAYNDDNQIVELVVKKFYGEEACVYVKLIELEGEDRSNTLDVYQINI